VCSNTELEDQNMSETSFFTSYPLNEFPFPSFPKVIDKLEYLGRNEEHTPYEISPGIDLCISDTYYSLGFLTFLHSFGKVINEGDKWVLEPKGKPMTDKPYRFTLIENVTMILGVLTKGSKTLEELSEKLPSIPSDQIQDYLKILELISHSGKVKQISKGWDASFMLKSW
jgi:hypothetical protein